MNDDYSWVTKHEIGSQGYTASFYYSYHRDVPDDASTVAVRATAWSFNDLRGDDVIEDGTVAYVLDSGTQSYNISGGESWITFDVETVALQKTQTLLVTDGNLTVEAASGETRMAGPERFVPLSLNVSSASGPFVAGINTVLVPRSLFLESGLWADFQAEAYGPLADAAYYGEDLTASEVSEDVAGLIAGNATGAEAAAVLDRLLRNGTDVLVYEAVDVTEGAWTTVSWVTTVDGVETLYRMLPKDL